MTQHSIIQQVAALIGQHVLAVDQHFFTLNPTIEGMEALKTSLEKQYQVSLDSDVFWDHPDIAQLATHIQQLLSNQA